MRRNALLASMLVAVIAIVVLVACGNQPAASGGGGSGSGASSASKSKTTKATKAPTKAADPAGDGDGEDDDDDTPAPTKVAAADDDEAGGDDEAPAAPAPTGEGANAGDDEGAPDPLLAQPTRQRGERVHIAQILILFRGSDRAGDEITRSRDEARTLARQIATEARAGDFSAIARQRSEDEASREGGGDLGEVERGTMPEALDRAAFALAPGAVSDVVESDFGFHVLKRLP